MWIKQKKRRRLSHEILGITFLCLVISAFLCCLLWGIGTVLAHRYFDFRTDIDYAVASTRIISVSVIISALFFTLLFLIVLGERLMYIRRMSDAVSAFKGGRDTLVLPLEGSNELTTLAETINAMSQREREFNEEREQLVRSLSHDIRTPLTSVMSYSQLLLTRDDLSGEAREYAEHIYQRSVQIKELTDVLLCGGKRELVRIENIGVLCEQLVCDFESELEDDFDLSLDVEYANSSAEADISEMRRIFDNLTSNISKYADPAAKVVLKMYTQDKSLVIEQSNTVKQGKTEGHGMGLKSIYRIADSYGGKVDVDENKFEIKIILPIL